MPRQVGLHMEKPKMQSQIVWAEKEKGEKKIEKARDFIPTTQEARFREATNIQRLLIMNAN